MMAQFNIQNEAQLTKNEKIKQMLEEFKQDFHDYCKPNNYINQLKEKEILDESDSDEYGDEYHSNYDGDEGEEGE